MQLKMTAGIKEYRTMTTEGIRSNYLINDAMCRDDIVLTYCEVERAIIGFAVPVEIPMALEANRKDMAADYFCQRREVGIINIGCDGRIKVDSSQYDMKRFDMLYIGRGCRDISFESIDKSNPAVFYTASYPAHTSYPTTHISYSQANRISLGSDELCNKRTINQYIYDGGIKSCQLVMGFTELAVGSVWNTMPAHTHQRRSEIYMYFDISADSAVFHLMGPSDETRHIVVGNYDIVVSPMWSIHSGVGTRNYRFVWAMGGENQAFDDMDGIEIMDLK